LRHNLLQGYSSTVGTGRVTPNNQGVPHNYINAHVLNNVLSSLGSVQGGGYTNIQRELYNLLQGSQLGSCSRKISNADGWFVDRSFSNEAVNDRSIGNRFTNYLQQNNTGSNELSKKREVKGAEKLSSLEIINEVKNPGFNLP